MTNQSESSNIRQCCVFLHNKCPSTRQSHLKRVICLSFPLAKRLGLYQRGRDEFSADTHSVWALSEHAFKWTLSSFASYYTRISKLSLLSSTTSNTITTAVLAHLHPLPFQSFSLSHFLLWHFSFLVHITKDSFHLLFMMDSSTFFKATYVISEFVAALNQTTKTRKASLLSTLSLVFFLLLWFWTRRWEARSWWSEHQSCQSAPRQVHHFLTVLWGPFLHYHCCLRQRTSANGPITVRISCSFLVCPFMIAQTCIVLSCWIKLWFVRFELTGSCSQVHFVYWDADDWDLQLLENELRSDLN